MIEKPKGRQNCWFRTKGPKKLSKKCIKISGPGQRDQRQKGSVSKKVHQFKKSPLRRKSRFPPSCQRPEAAETDCSFPPSVNACLPGNPLLSFLLYFLI